MFHVYNVSYFLNGALHKKSDKKIPEVMVLVLQTGGAFGIQIVQKKGCVEPKCRCRRVDQTTVKVRPRRCKQIVLNLNRSLRKEA